MWEPHLEDHSGGMDEPTGDATRRTLDSWDQFQLLSGGTVFARFVRVPLLQMSCRLVIRLGPAFVLCLRWTMEKSVSRKHSGCPFRGVARARQIGPPFRFLYHVFYTCTSPYWLPGAASRPPLRWEGNPHFSSASLPLHFFALSPYHYQPH